MKKSASKHKEHKQHEVVAQEQLESGEQGALNNTVGKLLYNKDGAEDENFSEEEGSDTELEIEQIETSTRLLQPRRTAGSGAAGGDSAKGWVPLVSAEEWTAAPSFLKMQVRGLHDE